MNFAWVAASNSAYPVATGATNIAYMANVSTNVQEYTYDYCRVNIVLT